MISKLEILPSTFIGSDFVQSSTGVIDTGNMNAGTIEWFIQPAPAAGDSVTLVLQEANENSESAFSTIAGTTNIFSESLFSPHFKHFGGFGRFLRVKATTTLSSGATGYTVRGVLSLKRRT